MTPVNHSNLRAFLKTIDEDRAIVADNLWIASREIHDRQNRPDSNENGRVHVTHVEDNIFTILKTARPSSDRRHLDELHPPEIFLLSCSACCHDFDKALKSAKPLPSRFEHGESSGMFVLKNARVLGLTDHDAKALSQVITIHDLKSPAFQEELQKLNWEVLTGSFCVNLQRVALLLKAADILHCDTSRVLKTGVDLAKLDGLERKKYLARSSTAGWKPDGTRIRIQANPDDPEKKTAFGECFRFMKEHEWQAVRFGLRGLDFPFELELDTITADALDGEIRDSERCAYTEKAATSESVLLVPSKASETFATRRDAAEKLGALFRDRAKNLIFVQAPFGWGKDVIMREALIAAGTPLHRTIDISRITDPRRLAEILLRYDRLAEHELFDIEDDFRTASEILRGKFQEKYRSPENCLLIFLYSNLNVDHHIPKPILNAIIVLAESGFRCVVESWDLVQTDLGRNLSSNSIAFFTRQDLPQLSDAEVVDWLRSRHIPDDCCGIQNAIRALEGHPLHIRVTLDALMRIAATGLSVTESDAVEESLKFLAGRSDFSIYEDYVLESLGGQLDLLLIQWASLIRDQAFPLHAFSNEQKKQAAMLVKLGLAYVQDAQIHPLGWFRFYCSNRLAQETQSKLLIGLSHLSEIDSTSRERIARDLTDSGASLGIVFDEQLLELAMALRELDSPCREEKQDVDEVEAARPVVAVLSETSLYLARKVTRLENEGDLAFAVYALEQLVRNEEWDSGQSLWESILVPEKRALLRMTLGHDWRVLRRLSRAFHLWRHTGRDHAVDLEALRDLVESIQVGWHGHRYYVARMLIEVGMSLCRCGRRVEAASITERLSVLISVLPEHGSNDSRYYSYLELEFLWHVFQHMVSESSAASLDALKAASSVTKKALLNAPENSKWQRRYLRVLGQLTGTLSLEQRETFARATHDQLNTMGHSPALLDFLLQRNWGILESDGANLLDRALTNLVRAVWKDRHPSKLDELYRSDYFCVICGVLACDSKAVRWAAQKAWNGLVAEAGAELESRERLLQLSTALLCVAERCQFSIRVKERTWPTLTGFLVKTIGRKVPQIAGVRPKTAQAFVFSLMRVIANAYHLTLPADPEAPEFSEANCHLDAASIDRAIFLLSRMAIENDRIYLGPILKTHLRYARSKWQSELRLARRDGNESLPEYHKQFEAVIDLYKNRLTGRFPLVSEQAHAERYVWNFERALTLGEEAFDKAVSFEERRGALLFLLEEILVPALFTPRFLYTEFLLPADEELETRLKRYAGIFVDLFPDELWRHVYVESRERSSDEGFWDSLLRPVEERLTHIEEYWRLAAEAPVIDAHNEWTEGTVEDLTDSFRLKMVAHPLRWGADQETLPDSLRFRIAESAVRCSFAGRAWSLGCGKRSIPSETFGLATSILMAWRVGAKLNGPGEPIRILGSETCEPLGRRPTRLAWPDAVKRQFEILIQPSMTQGNFQKHVRILWENVVKPLWRGTLV